MLSISITKYKLTIITYPALKSRNLHADIFYQTIHDDIIFVLSLCERLFEVDI